jgi:hypothetical protein
MAAFLGEIRRLGMPSRRTKTDPHVFDIAIFREVHSTSPTANLSRAQRLASMTQPYHGGVWLVKRGISEGCLEQWGRNVLEEARAKPSRVVRDQIQIARAIKTGECTPYPLDATYLYKVMVSRAGDLRPLQHVTRTGLVTSKLLDERHWSAFGEVLLGINGTAANQTHATLARRTFDRLLWRKKEPSGFRWWTASNPECVPSAAGSVQSQAVRAGWLPLTKAPPRVLLSDAAACLLAAAALAAAAMAMAVCRRRLRAGGGWRCGVRHRHRAGAERIIDSITLKPAHPY